MSTSVEAPYFSGVSLFASRNKQKNQAFQFNKACKMKDVETKEGILSLLTSIPGDCKIARYTEPSYCGVILVYLSQNLDVIYISKSSSRSQS